MSSKERFACGPACLESLEQRLLLSGITERVSLTSEGVEGNGTSTNAVISGDGRYVAFMSSANNLVPGDTNWTLDVFRYDRLTDTIARVSVASGGTDPNSASYTPSISAHGRFVANGPETLRQIVEVNFFAAAELTRLAIPLLSKGNQSLVVNIGTILGHRGIPHNREYSQSNTL